MSQNAMPRIAVIVPCFNDGQTLRATINSVRRQEPCELVVVDDGSSDELTLRVFDELEANGVRVIHQENRGLAAARMAGLAATSARYVLPLGADDMLLPGAVSRLADELDDHPEHAACWGDIQGFGDQHILTRSPERLDPWRITYYNGVPYSSMLRREAVEAVGGWQLRGGYEDWDLWMSLAEHGYTGMSAGVPCVGYRIHGQRMWIDAVARHDEIYTYLRRRHPKLFAMRRRNWLCSEEPWAMKLSLPLISALRLPVKNARRLYALAYSPGEVLTFARRRARASLRRRAHDRLILCYHAVSDTWPADLSIPADVLEGQLLYLLERGYRGVTLSEALADRTGDGTLVVTFDDGYRSTIERAAPVLERLGIPATLFVPVDFIGGERLSWPGIERWLAGAHESELTPLTWDEVSTLTEQGWEIGSHGCTHPHLRELGEGALARELQRSREVCEERLGRPCRAIAYPFGDVDERVLEAASAAGYRHGVSLPARWPRNRDPLNLPRVGVYRRQSLARFRFKTSAAVRGLRYVARR